MPVSRNLLPVMFVLGMAACLLAQEASESAPARPKGTGDTPKRVVVQLKGIAATDAAAALGNLLRAEGQGSPGAAAPGRSVVLVPEMSSNSLVISGSPEAVEEVRQLADQLDRPAAMVQLEVVLEQSAAAAWCADAARRSKRPRKSRHARPSLPEPRFSACAMITTLSGQRASLQIGRSEGTIAGVSMTRGGMVNQVRYESLGTKIDITPAVSPEGMVTLEIEVNDTRSGPPEAGAVIAESKEGKPPVRTPNKETYTARSTIQVPSGETAVLAGMAVQPKSDSDRIIRVTPRVLQMDGRPPAR